MKEIIINIDNFNKNSIKTIEGNNLSEVYKIYILKNKRRVDLTNKIAIMAYLNERGNKRSNILALNVTNPKEGEIELPITNVISQQNGLYACQIAIYGENNSLEQTAPFNLVVENNIFSEVSSDAVNSNDFQILSEAIKTTNEYGEKLKQGTEKIELQYANKLNKLNSQISAVANGNGFIEINNKLKGASVYLPYREDLNGSFEDNVEKAIDSNCNTVEICPMFWMSSSTSNSIDGLKSGLTKEYILEKCKYVKENGMKVLLKPHVTGNGFTGWGNINPDDVVSWINSYSQLLLEVVSLCKDYIDLISITNECKGQTNQQKDLWVNLINSIKAINPNILTLSATTFHELKTCVFLEELDLLGVNMYVPVIGDLSTAFNLQKASLFSESEYISEMLRYSKKLNKKIIVTEVGILPFARALQNPEAWGFDDNPPISLETQVRYYNLTIKEYIHSDSILGVMVWNICDGYSFIDRPAQQTLKIIFGGGENV